MDRPGPLNTGADGSGIELARAYHAEVVRPLLVGRWPDLACSAARLGSGSDVLGLDDAVSRDHDWGLRLTLLLDEDRVPEVADHLERELPHAYRGLPTRFATTWDPVVRQRVEVAGPDAFALSRLGIDVTRAWDAGDWLSLTGQAVLEVTAGPVFTDTHGGITAIRNRLTWYPDDVWRHVVAVDWQRLGQLLPLLGRAGQRGDDLGARVLVADVVRVAVHLGFLLERRWSPYPKWAGTLFAGLPRGAGALPALVAALETRTPDDGRTTSAKPWSCCTRSNTPPGCRPDRLRPNPSGTGRSAPSGPPSPPCCSTPSGIRGCAGSPTASGPSSSGSTAPWC